MIKLLVITGLSFFYPTAPQDSIGTEIIGGKTMVVHKVGAGETLYGISRHYGVTVTQILEYNPSADSGLEIDQILKIPYVPRVKQRVQPGGNTHIVAEKETLFSISRQYGVTIDELKQWNNLTDNALALGQELMIKKKNTTTIPATTPVEMKTAKTVHTVAAKETMFSITRQYGITIQQLREWNNLQTDELKIGQLLFVAQPIYTQNQPVTTPPEEKKPDSVVVPAVEPEKKPDVTPPVIEKTPTIRISENVKGSDEIIEAGLAELIEGTESNRKYLALHRTAPVGTILKIRNEMNNREVFVRVMGKLPDTALTDKLVIKISKSAYDRLGAIDPRFRVEVTYYK